MRVCAAHSTSNLFIVGEKERESASSHACQPFALFDRLFSIARRRRQIQCVDAAARLPTKRWPWAQTSASTAASASVALDSTVS
eukprot:scaffold56064_cov26-Tisochrysis_lutea.AAC.1